MRQMITNSFPLTQTVPAVRQNQNNFFIGLALFSLLFLLCSFQQKKPQTYNSKPRSFWSDFRSCLTQEMGNNITSLSFVDHQLCFMY